MSASQLLTDMLDLLKAQTEAVVVGDHEAILAGAERHEQLLALLPSAQLDAPPAELRALRDQLEAEKSKLRSLLTSESTRVDYLLRLILGGGQPKAGGYPVAGARAEGPARMLNRRA